MELDTVRSRRGINYRGDEMIRGFSLAYPGLWEAFMREIRILQVDQPNLLVRDVMANLVRRFLSEANQVRDG